MRLNLKLKVDHLTLPLAYKSILQGTIYHMMDRQTIGDFYHNKGFQDQEKVYKMFVFSDLFGKYQIMNKKIIFEDQVRFSISIMDHNLFQAIYKYLLSHRYLMIQNQKVMISHIDIDDLKYFHGNKSMIIKTLSPIVAYKSKNKYFTYYKPSDELFQELIKDNIMRKSSSYQFPLTEYVFHLNDVIYEKKRMVYFKDNFFEAYQCELSIETNYETLKIIYDTGLSAKGSCGFGMIEIKDEKDILSV